MAIEGVHIDHSVMDKMHEDREIFELKNEDKIDYIYIHI
jgi:hypothetical protein